MSNYFFKVMRLNRNAWVDLNWQLIKAGCWVIVWRWPFNNKLAVQIPENPAKSKKTNKTKKLTDKYNKNKVLIHGCVKQSWTATNIKLILEVY